MVKLSVTKEDDGRSGLMNIELSSITHMETLTYENLLIVHTDTKEQFFTCGSLTYWERILNQSNVPAVRTDRATLVIIRYIESLIINWKQQEVVFAGGITARISKKHYNDVVPRIEEWLKKRR